MHLAFNEHLSNRPRVFAVSICAQWCHVKNRDMLDVIDIALVIRLASAIPRERQIDK